MPREKTSVSRETTEAIWEMSRRAGANQRALAEELGVTPPP